MRPVASPSSTANVSRNATRAKFGSAAASGNSSRKVASAVSKKRGFELDEARRATPGSVRAATASSSHGSNVARKHCSYSSASRPRASAAPRAGRRRSPGTHGCAAREVLDRGEDQVFLRGEVVHLRAARHAGAAHDLGRRRAGPAPLDEAFDRGVEQPDLGGGAALGVANGGWRHDGRGGHPRHHDPNLTYSQACM